MGPLLFILFTNDFEKSNMYADDKSIFSSNENPLQLLQDLKREVEGIMEWLRQNKLSLNVAKCQYIFLGNNISEIGNIEIDKYEIKRVDRAKI